MKYTIEEMQAMLNIVSAVLANRKFQRGMTLRTSTVYDIDDFDIETMQKWTAYWQKTIDAAKARLGFDDGDDLKHVYSFNGGIFILERDL